MRTKTQVLIVGAGPAGQATEGVTQRLKEAVHKSPGGEGQGIVSRGYGVGFGEIRREGPA